MSNTNADDWFLKGKSPTDPTSIDEFRNADRKLFDYTPINQVEALVDGASYMKRLYDIINKTASGDFIYYAGFELVHDLPLIPTGIKNTMIDVLSEARNTRHVDVRVLLSGNISTNNFNVTTLKHLWDNNIECILDVTPVLSSFYGRLTSSAHQKFACIQAEGKYHGFCGGIDVTYDRWDTNAHGDDPATDLDWRDRLYRRNFDGGWHDVHTYLQGLACTDLIVSFRERWNFNAAHPGVQSLYNLQEGYQPTMLTPTGQSGDHTTIQGGTHSVQVLRTYPCDDPLGVELPFATSGEMSAREACLKSIRQAEYLIYIEDQYFYSYEIARALIDVLSDPSKPNLRVLVLAAREPSDDFGKTYANLFHYIMIEMIKEEIKGKAEDRFAIYHLDSTVIPGEQVYVHAKLMIIDDVWVEIGSMNCNRRSMTNDFEMCVAIVDDVTMTIPVMGEVCKFAHELRLRLWAEHLGLDISQVPHDPIVGFKLWEDRNIVSNVRATRYDASTKRVDYSPYVVDNWNTWIDIQGTCPDEPRIPPLSFE